MDAVRDAREAKEFLISKIAAEAQSEKDQLSETERKMLYFTESGWTLPERSITDTLVMILNEAGFEARGAYNGLDGAMQARDQCPNILLSDVLMPKMDGIQLAIEVLKACPETRVVLISGQAATADYLERARSQGYEFEFLPKPLEPEELLAHLG